MNIILLGCVAMVALAGTAASCSVCCVRRHTSCQGRGQESGNSASGHDSGEYGRKGQDSDNKGQDSGNSSNNGKDSGNKGQISDNKGQDSGNSGNKGQGSDDSGSKGSSAGAGVDLAAGEKPRTEQLSISSGDTTVTKTVAGAERGAAAAGGASGSNN